MEFYTLHAPLWVSQQGSPSNIFCNYCPIFLVLLFLGFWFYAFVICFSLEKKNWTSSSLPMQSFPRGYNSVLFVSGIDAGANHYYYICLNDLLALGGGGSFALCLDGDLWVGFPLELLSTTLVIRENLLDCFLSCNKIKWNQRTMWHIW